MSRQLAKGATIKTTHLNENVGWLEYPEKNRGVEPLFARIEEGKTIALNGKTTPSLPCTLISLVHNEKSTASKH